MSEALLQVSDLSARYDATEVLSGIELAVRQHSVTALLGANGAGKTTLLRALCGMVSARGSIRFDGHELLGLRTDQIVRRGIAHVPDGRGTLQDLTTEENLRLGAYVRRDRAEVPHDIERVFGWFPRLKERRRQQAGTLSGGEQQMLAIGRALMLRPRLLLLDEPSFGLAPIIVREIFEIIARINRDEQVSMLIVEQNSALALELADHGYVLVNGRVAISGPGAELRSSESIRRAYLGD
jgi:branched-chain amino acid transport system ATP-binding protein